MIAFSKEIDFRSITSKFDINSKDLLKIAAGGLVAFTLAYAGKIWWSYGYFEKRGIKTPPYKFVSGNFSEILEKGYSVALKDWTSELGPTYGIYEGHLPILVTSDLEIIQEVLIKKFSYFSGRKLGPMQTDDNSGNVDLFNASKDTWKRLRNIINPTFSSHKLKELLPLMRLCTLRLVDVISKNTDKEINASDFLERLTMDTIWNCAFGLDIDCQNNPNNPFLVYASKHFKLRADHPITYLLRAYFHEFKIIFVTISYLTGYVFKSINENLLLPIVYLILRINEILDKRLEKNIQRKDYIQLLLDSQADSVDQTNINFDISSIKIQKKLTYKEIKSNLVLFLLAGYETTSSALSYSLFVLAQHPEEMEKLQNEIDEHFASTNIEPDIENIQNLDYLDMFVKEVLRFYPIGNAAITRRCLVPIKIKGMDIPKGLVIAVDVLSVHFNPEYWGDVDPNTFYPSRFASGNKINPIAYLPFGLGPKNCVGMRFAILEMKLALVKLLLKFSVYPTANTPEKLQFSEGIVRRPRHGIPLMFKKRVNQS